MRHIIPISGKDSLATAIWQTAHQPEFPYEFVFNDTHAELPDTYDWLDRVESTLGISITRIGKSLEQIIDNEGMLPSANTRFCTRLAKIRPLNSFLGGDPSIVYFGLRADEPDRAGAFETKNLTPKYPLREAGIGVATVYRIVEMRDLMPPSFFWKRLYDEVRRQMKDHLQNVEEQWPKWMKSRVFAWRSRPNCFFCFFQRHYEWVGLLEHHPKLFKRAEEIEAKAQRDRRENPFFWVKDTPLSAIRNKAARIFTQRADAICALIDGARQAQLFEDSFDQMDAAGTSCGLLCGK